MAELPAASAARRTPPGLAPTLAFLAVLALVEAWARHAADPDFPLLDPFHGLVIGLLALFALACFVQGRRRRIGLLTLAYAIPLGVLGAEWLSARHDVDIANRRIAVSEDALLRYTYRPGAQVHSGSGEGSSVLTVTDDGLLDVPHVVPKPADVDRVVVLGDSVPNDGSIPFTQRFPHQLEEMLAAHAPSGRRAEIVNVSCEGYNTIQEERLFERVGLRYQPDVVVVAYVLNDPFLQNATYRRVGNSFFAFNLIPLANMVTGGSYCDMFAPMHEGYAFELVVRGSLERLRLIADREHFRVLVAPLPILERFDDPVCKSLYDRVIDIGRAQGFAGTRVLDAFQGEDFHHYQKSGADRLDMIHPTAEAHERMARHLAAVVAPILWPSEAHPAP